MGNANGKAEQYRAQTEYDALFPTPICNLGIRAEDGVLAKIDFLPRSMKSQYPRNDTALLVWRELQRYLDDPGFRFSIQTKHRGTEHQRAVWLQMRLIKPGRTMTYGEIAERLRSSPRAVGQACGANPTPIVIPCHRIVARGGIGGFAHRANGFPLTVKRWLLAHENAIW